MSARLYSISLSHPAAASKLALGFKGVDYETVELLPGLHPLVVKARGFGAETVPALQIDGVRVQGSREIAEYLERTRPEPSLYPPEPELRARVERAESWGERTLQPVPRRIFRYAATTNNDLRRWMAELVGMPLPAVMARVNKPVAALMGRRVGAGEAQVRADVAALPQTLDQVDQLIAEGVIGGEQPNAADFQILTTVRSLESFTDLRPLLEGRAAQRLAATVAPPSPGPVPPCLPPEWLADRAERLRDSS